MPVFTRSQMKITNEMKTEFIKDLNYLIYCCSEVVGQDNKMGICLEIFQRINQDLPILIERTSITMWLKFILTLRDKVNELQEQVEENLSEYDKTLTKNFYKELYKAKKLTISIIENSTLP
jgi:hypothetical protein